MGRMPRVFSAPIVAPTMGGTRLKKAPHPIPLKIKNTEKMPTVEANGQTTRELRPMNRRQSTKLLRGPSSTSAVYPPRTRPTVEARFQAAKMTMAIWLEYPIDLEKMGIKYGGINSGKHEMAVPTTMSRNLGSLKRYLRQRLEEYTISKTRLLTIEVSSWRSLNPWVVG